MRSRKSPSIGRGLFLGSSALIQTLCSTATPLRAGKRTEQFRVVESFPNGEDPATGSASGCLVSLLVKQGRLGTGEQILIEQGDQIHRPSRIYGSAAIRGGKVHSVHIGGYAIQVASGEYVL